MTKESLPEFIKRIRSEKKLPLRTVGERSGGGITGAYVNQIENKHRAVANLSVEVLQGLAKGLGVSENEVFAVARGAVITEEEKIANDFALMAQKYSSASEDDKEKLKPILEMLMRELDRVDQNISASKVKEDLPVRPPAFNKSPEERRKAAQKNDTVDKSKTA